MRFNFLFGLVAALATLVAAGTSYAQTNSPGVAEASAHWVGTWGTSPQLVEPRNMPPQPGLSGNTLRQVVHVSIGGKRLRVRFSNAFGSHPVTMHTAHLALSAGEDAIETENDVRLTFDGKASVTIPTGETILSDPFDFDLHPLADLAVTIYFAETPVYLTGHPGSRATSYLDPGNSISAPELPTAAKMQHWYILNGIDVQAADASAAVVALGDSITDGRGSEPDHNNRWSDDLSNLLHANKKTADIGVLNEGIGGNCILHGGLGPTMLSRFERDVLSQSSVRWVIVLEGINDIGGNRSTNSPLAQNLIDAFQKIIDQAHAKNIRVYGATILPFEGSNYFSADHEATRATVNQWIRTGGKFDAVIDFDAATRDPQNLLHLAAKADSGDHLHPSVKGYQMMADAIDLKLFSK